LCLQAADRIVAGVTPVHDKELCSLATVASIVHLISFPENFRIKRTRTLPAPTVGVPALQVQDVVLDVKGELLGALICNISTKEK